MTILIFVAATSSVDIYIRKDEISDFYYDESHLATHLSLKNGQFFYVRESPESIIKALKGN
jgi:hypothetical protein